MMNMREMCRYLTIEATEEQLIAGRFLESRGRMFCGHFGTDNAVKLADELFDQECTETPVQ